MLPKGEQARVRAGVPYVGFALAALGRARPADADRRPPGRADRADEHRRAVARGGRRSGGGTAMKRALVLAVLLAAAAFSGGVGRSQATFVASSSHASADLRRLPRLQRRRGLARRPGHAAARLRPAVGDGHLGPRAGRRSPSSARPPAPAPGRRSAPPPPPPTPARGTPPGVADGLYDLRATALDASGYSRTEHGRARAGSTTPRRPPASAPPPRSPAPRRSAPPRPTAAAA